jgi:hypothetical protein
MEGSGRVSDHNRFQAVIGKGFGDLIEERFRVHRWQ